MDPSLRAPGGQGLGFRWSQLRPQGLREAGWGELWLCRDRLCQALAGKQEQAVPHPSLPLSAPAVTCWNRAGSSAFTSAPAACHWEALSASVSLWAGALPAHHHLFHSALKHEAGAAASQPQQQIELVSSHRGSRTRCPRAGSDTQHFFHPFTQTWMPGQEFGGFPALRSSFSRPCKCSKPVGAQTCEHCSE